MKLEFQDHSFAILTSDAQSILRLRTEFSKRNIGVEAVNRTSFRFARSSIAQVIDLFSESESQEIIAAKKLFESHKMAIDKARKIRYSGVPEGVSDKWIEQLDPPQAMAVSELILDDALGVCLFDEQGSGKTVMSIAAFDILKKRGSVDAMIVVCPKSMANEWPKDVERFTGDDYKVTVADGGRDVRRESVLSNFDVLIVGYEGLSSILQNLISKADIKKYLLVADESFFVKNESAARSQTITKLRQYCRKCFVLCGTPAPNSPYDLVNQMNLADLGYAFGNFSKSRSIEDDTALISNILESKASYIRRLKTEILNNVPDKKFHVIRVPMLGRQATMYEKARSSLEIELTSLGNEKFKRNIASYLQKRSVLLQICSCPEAIDPTYFDTPGKYIELDKIVDRLVGQNRKLIIWSFYINSIESLVNRYKMHRPLRIDGSISGESRKKAVIDFQSDPSALILVANPAAAGAGITLHSSYDAVYFSYSNKAADYLQSLDRIHRRGQSSDHVNYYLLVSENTIEENEIKRLRAKEVNQGNLLGDYTPWPTSFDDALAELKGHA